MNAVNSVIGYIIDLSLSPFRGLAPGWGLVFVSIVTGIALLFVYGKVSNQKAIKNTKRKIYSYVLESVLYRQSLATSLRAQAKMLWQACVYFALAIPPIIILAIPCILILAQLNRWYESRPLNVGEDAIITAEVSADSSPFKVSLVAPAGLEVTPPVRNEAEHTIAWRVRPTTEGILPAEIQVEGSAGTLRKEVVAGGRFAPLTSGAYRDFWMSFFYPGDPSLSKSTLPLEALWIEYPSRTLSLFGINMHWLVIFLLVSVVAGIVASRFMGIEI